VANSASSGTTGTTRRSSGWNPLEREVLHEHRQKFASVPVNGVGSLLPRRSVMTTRYCSLGKEKAYALPAFIVFLAGDDQMPSGCAFARVHKAILVQARLGYKGMRE